MSRRAALLALVLGCAAASGCESAIVGAACQPGFELCGEECVNLRADFRNCGACGNRCARFSCYEGVCGDGPAGGKGGQGGGGGRQSSGPRDAGAIDAESGETFDASSGDASSAVDGAGLDGCPIGERECGGACVNPATDASNCGSCGRACAPNQTCSLGVCAETCASGLFVCGGQCHDPTTDPDHCGSCGARCASGICEAASCADAIAGQLVVIGHDFSSANAAMRRIAGNAVFLARGAPVHVLAYRGKASDETVRGVEAAIEFTRAEIGRAWEKVDASDDLVPLQLAAADVLLIHAQAGARADALLELGRKWSTALSQFLSRGGAVVLFEAPSTLNDGTFKLLEPARLFGAARRVEIPVQALTVQTPGLGVALRVPDRYMSAAHTVRFEGLGEGTPIVVDQTGNPVVVQRVISP